jgi:hypothetical protein
MTVRIDNLTPDLPVGERTFQVTLDESTLDRIRGVLGWLQGDPELRAGMSAFYFAAGDALGYRDDPSMTRGRDNGAPILVAVEGRQAGLPLVERR